MRSIEEVKEIRERAQSRTARLRAEAYLAEQVAEAWSHVVVLRARAQEYIRIEADGAGALWVQAQREALRAARVAADNLDGVVRHFLNADVAELNGVNPQTFKRIARSMEGLQGYEMVREAQREATEAMRHLDRIVEANSTEGEDSATSP